MNYHIMIDDKFIDGFITDAENVSSENSNRYFIRGTKQNAIYVNHPKAEWIENIWSNDFREILNQITVLDKIIIHWYNLDVGKLMLTIDKNIPLYVAFWGGEFYEEPFLHHINWLHDTITLRYVIKTYILPKKWAKRPILFLKQLWSLINYKKGTQQLFEIKKQTVHRINYLLVDTSVFFGDHDKIKSIYKIKELNGLPFIYNQNFDSARELKTTVVKGNTVNIQIGNSATETNNHVDCIKVLKKYNKEKIKLIIPLSYGHFDYAEFVTQYCIKTYNNKYELLEKFMPREEYIKKLNEIDIAIMFHNRSQAFGNCITLLTLGKKLYLKNNNPFWPLFKKLGIVVFDANTIKDLTFEEFSKPLTEDQIQSNIEKISNLFSEKKRLEYLSNILN